MRSILRVSLLITPLLVACEPRAPVVRTLPELVIEPSHAELPTEMHVLLPPGEQLIWDVRAAGFSLGRVDWVVGDVEVHSRFATGEVASAFGAAHHELTTVIDRAAGRAVSADEQFDHGGDHRKAMTSISADSYAVDGGARRALPAHGVGYTIHTAIGALRAWSASEHHAGTIELSVIVLGEPHRLTIEQVRDDEVGGTKAVRLDGHVDVDGTPAQFVLWLAATPTRIPLRMTIGVRGLSVVAQLVDG